MTQAIRQLVQVKPGGIIEIRSPELKAGAMAEVLVLIEPERPGGCTRSDELAALLEATQALPSARAMGEEEIAAEVAAYRAERR